MKLIKHLKTKQQQQQNKKNKTKKKHAVALRHSEFNINI